MLDLGARSPSASALATDRGYLALAAVVAVWLIASLYYVNIDFDDGYSAIANSQYFLGLSDNYYWQRGPMMAWILLPAEWIANSIRLHPMNVRVHHAVMVLLHLVYFVGVWRLLRATHGARPIVLLAFAAAVPTVLFFSYAPFVSHDIFPGLILLLMLVRANAYMEMSSRRNWTLLVMLGALAALTKQTYAAFWGAVLIAQVANFPAAKVDRRLWVRRWLQLFAAATLSGVLVWFGYAVALATSFPESYWLLTPWAQMQSVVGVYQEREGPLNEMFYQWVYLRNLSAYGMLAMALVLPGLWLSLRHPNPLQRSIAWAWILLFALVQVISFKETRYLAFLAPLTAFLIVPTLDLLLRWNRAYLLLLLGLLVLDVRAAGAEAGRITDGFYRSAVTDFLRLLPTSEQPLAPVVFTERLTFLSNDAWAFFGDRYHRLSHLNHAQVRDLFGYKADKVRFVSNPRMLRTEDFEPGQILVFVNDFGARVPPIAPDNRTTLQPHFVQLVAVAELEDLRLEGADYVVEESGQAPLMLLPSSASAQEPLTSFERFNAAKTIAALGLKDQPEKLNVLAFRIRSYCRLDGCRTF